MEDDLISVIVPMYNAELYIRKCLTSILKQTYKKIEIIVVDDGSTDYGAEICRSLGKCDSRIRLFFQENRGVSEARNTGLEKSEGTYVVFVDADDYVQPDYVEVLYQQIKKTKADVAICSYSKYEEVDEVLYEKVFSAKNAVIQMLLSVEFDSCICCKMCPAKLAKKIGFHSEYCVAEDLLFYYEIFLHCRKISYINHKSYHYVQHKNSTLHTPLNLAKIRSMQVFEEMLKLCRDEVIKEAIVIKYVSTCFYLLSLERKYIPKKEVGKLKQVIKRYRLRMIVSKMAKTKVKLACLLSYFSFQLVTQIQKKYRGEKNDTSAACCSYHGMRGH